VKLACLMLVAAIVVIMVLAFWCSLLLEPAVTDDE
jgi:hypothetical protein